MNFSIHIDDKTAKTLKKMAKEKGETRNALISEALHQYVAGQSRSEWPEKARQFAGALKDMPRFEDYRKELLPPKEDPFE